MLPPPGSPARLTKVTGEGAAYGGAVRDLQAEGTEEDLGTN